MSFHRIRTKTNCVEGRKNSATTIFVRLISFIITTGKELKFSVGQCSICYKKIEYRY